MSYGKLYAPLFPQMEGDGTINLSELLSSGIIIDVAEYESAQKGDYIELWFESYSIGSLGLAEEPVSQYFPWQCSITPKMASLIQDGVYQVQYKVVDIAQNNTWSAIGNAIIDRSASGTLPPPLFPEAGADNTLSYEDALSQGGTPVTIPAFPGIAVNDNIKLYWAGFNNGTLVQNSITCVSHTVQQGELNGFDINIATAFIVAGKIDSAKAWYVVDYADQRNARSEYGQVNIDTSTGKLLPPPDFIEGEDDWIDADEAYSSSGTPVHIPAYPGINTGDIVSVFWQGFTSRGEKVADASYEYISPVASDDLTNGLIVTIPTAFILPVGIGYGICYYNVVSENGEQGTSLAAEVGVDVIHSDELPAPQLPEALDDGVIDNNDAMSNGGTLVTISYPSMAEADHVTINWCCYHDAEITPVVGTVYSVTHSVSASEAIACEFSVTVPSKYITPTGKGYAVVNYTVSYQSGGIGYSDDATATIDTQGDAINGSNYLGCSTGYAPWNNTVLQDCYVKYRAVANGVPLRYAKVTFTLYGNNYFTNNALKTITVQTDFNGYAVTNISGSDTTLNTITAQVQDSTIPISTIGIETERTNDIVIPSLISEPYIPGSGLRQFTLRVSQDTGVFTLSTNNNADIFIDGVNKGGIVNNVEVSAASALEFSVSSNNLNNTKLTVSALAPETKDFCSIYF